MRARMKTNIIYLRHILECMCASRNMSWLVAIPSLPTHTLQDATLRTLNHDWATQRPRFQQKAAIHTPMAADCGYPAMFWCITIWVSIWSKFWDDLFIVIFRAKQAVAAMLATDSAP